MDNSPNYIIHVISIYRLFPLNATVYFHFISIYYRDRRAAAAGHSRGGRRDGLHCGEPRTDRVIFGVGNIDVQ